jgi:hypothetical protein
MSVFDSRAQTAGPPWPIHPGTSPQITNSGSEPPISFTCTRAAHRAPSFSIVLPSSRRIGHVRDWWPNRILPAIVAVVAARLLYVTFSGGPNAALIAFGAVVGGLPALYFLAVHAVGFGYGLLGREPSEKTRWFEVGWHAGLTRARPRARSRPQPIDALQSTGPEHDHPCGMPFGIGTSGPLRPRTLGESDDWVMTPFQTQYRRHRLCLDASEGELSCPRRKSQTRWLTKRWLNR